VGYVANSSDQCIDDDQKGYYQQQNADAVKSIPFSVIALPARRRRCCVQGSNAIVDWHQRTNAKDDSHPPRALPRSVKVQA
jgi:hypothetical protein